MQVRLFSQLHASLSQDKDGFCKQPSVPVLTFPPRAVLWLCAGAWHLHTALLCYGKPGMRELIAGDK